MDKYTSGAYGDLFRRGSDTTGLDDFYPDTEQDYFAPPDAGAPAQFLEENRGQLCQGAGAQSAIDATNGTADSPRIESADETLTRKVQEELLLRCGH
jgi:hypothetical protein